ncbi:MAG: peptidase C45, partial [Acidobacteria bacterium]|nr:peptidase C45 [Acidobacteriota bacterium]
ISRFSGFDPKGVPEFVRARAAMQYASSIDDFARIMQDGNNGGYANDWLVADRKTNEIASLELGLKNVTLERTKDGYFAGSNYPINPKLAREETDFDLHDMSLSPNARRLRWQQLLEQNKGKIDVRAAQAFLADHYDTYEKKEDPNERTLDGHIDLSPRGSRPWQPPYGIAGAVQNKVASAAMAERMSMSVAMGHACGMPFKAADHLRKHPEFAWQRAILRDLPARGWTTFTAK